MRWRMGTGRTRLLERTGGRSLGLGNRGWVNDPCDRWWDFGRTKALSPGDILSTGTLICSTAQSKARGTQLCGDCEADHPSEAGAAPAAVPQAAGRLACYEGRPPNREGDAQKAAALSHTLGGRGDFFWRGRLARHDLWMKSYTKTRFAIATCIGGPNPNRVANGPENGDRVKSGTRSFLFSENQKASSDGISEQENLPQIIPDSSNKKEID